MNKVIIITADTSLDLENRINDFARYNHIVQVSYQCIPDTLLRRYQALILYKED